MAYGIIHFYPNGTKARYDAEIAVVHPHGGASLPAGQLYHAAGPSPGGWSNGIGEIFLASFCLKSYPD